MHELSPELLDSLADAIAKRVAERLASAAPQARLVDAHGLAEAVGLSVPTIHRAVAAGRIPSIQAGKRRLYDILEVIEAMRAAGPELTNGKTTRAQQA